eukprot:12365902-Alexandrium_andersonii.AAC.1
MADTQGQRTSERTDSHQTTSEREAYLPRPWQALAKCGATAKANAQASTPTINRKAEGSALPKALAS